MKNLKIIHVADFGLGRSKSYLGGVAAKLSNGWTRAGHNVANFSDRDIARWNGFGHKMWGKRAANKLLLDLCRTEQPDLVALGHADVINSETLDQVRAAVPSIKILHWHVDWIVPRDLALPNDPTSANIRMRIRSRLEFVDAVFVTTAGSNLVQFADTNTIVGFMPNPVDPSVERGRNFERDDLPYDIFFSSGSDDDRRFHCGGWQSMAELARELESKLPTSSFCLLGLNGQPKLFGPRHENALMCSRIGLNISRRNDIYLYSSDRIAQLVGNGLAVCIDRATGYNDLFDDASLVFYSSVAELAEKLARLKRDDHMRRAIAERGWRRYFELFESSIVGQYMIDATFRRHDPSRYAWPTLVEPSATVTS